MFSREILYKTLRTNGRQVDQIIRNLSNYYYVKTFQKLNPDGTPAFDSLGNPRVREITPTYGQLKNIQKLILNKVLKAIKLPDYAFGGVNGKDNIKNAKYHQGNKYFFNTDLRGYYPGITNRQVFETFVKHKIPTETANILTKLTTYKGSLPQGTHTSPYIANLVFTEVGNKLLQLAKKYDLTFTSFVDDLTFSSKIDFKEHIPEILEIIQDGNFRISHNKTFYETKNPKVTQILVRNNFLALPGKYRKIIDGMNDVEKSAPKGVGIINYYERVKSIGKTKRKKIFI